MDYLEGFGAGLVGAAAAVIVVSALVVLFPVGIAATGSGGIGAVSPGSILMAPVAVAGFVGAVAGFLIGAWRVRRRSPAA